MTEEEELAALRERVTHLREMASLQAEISQLQRAITGEIPKCERRRLREPKPPRERRVLSRQEKALRGWVAAVAVIVVLVLSLGLTEASLHSFSFFVFRAQGVGSTPDSGLNEDQGPGQPDANGQHGCASNSVGTCEGKTIVQVSRR